MLVVVPLGLEWPARSSDRAFRLKGLVAPLSGRKEGLHQGGEREVDTVGAHSLAQASKLNFKANYGSKPLLSGSLTFSSIPPLTTGSGSGPAWEENNRRTRG